MCSLLYNGGLPFLGPASKRHSAVTDDNAAAQKSSSDGPLLVRLARAAGKPGAALERLIGDFQTAQPQGSAAWPSIEERILLLNVQLKSATSLTQWQTAASELDYIEGNNDWKEDDESQEYNHKLIQARLERLDEARSSCDAPRMLFLIRTALSRHLGGMSNIQLYQHSHVGTKRLIEKYISSALETLSALVELTKRQYNIGLDSRLVLEQVLQARQSFGRSALLLSGGGTFGMSHSGVVKCLWEQQLLPRIISGSSAGSIVCAVLCVKTDDELPDTLEEFCYGDLNVFTDIAGRDTVLTQVTRFLKTGALFDINNLLRVMRNLVGDLTFQEAYNRTRRILNITVSSASVFELPRLLNYVTSPNVVIWSAVAASCSVPVIFSPADLLAKDPRTGKMSPWNPSSQRWIDGSVDNDLPMTRLAELFNVNHFIVSQVNPHVVPFLEREEYRIAKEARANEKSRAPGPSWLNLMANMAKGEAMHRMNIVSELGILPNLLTKTMSMLNQKYSGDITILPEVPYAQFPKILVNPNTEVMLQSMLSGEQATWPRLSRIQNHCAIELALDDAVQHLRARIAFSPSSIDLRLGTLHRPLSRAGSESRRLRHGTQRKRLRFSGDANDEQTSANSSKPLSIHGTPATPNASVKRMQRPGTPMHLDIKSASSPPMFSTGSEADSDSSSDAADSDSDTTSPLEEPSFDVGRRRYLFPYASQPSTPQGTSTHRNTYFNFTASPHEQTVTAATPSPHLELRMTPATSRRSILDLKEADGRRKKNAGSTPRMTSPVRSRDTVRSSQDSQDVSTATTPRTATEGMRTPPANPRSPPELTTALANLDVSGTKGMLHRKKSSKSKGKSGFLRMSSPRQSQ